MPSLKDVQNKIGAVKKTKQITKAMNMVATSRLRGAQANMQNFRPYAGKFAEVLGSLAEKSGDEASPLLIPREEVKKIHVVLCTSDRGLCAGFNVNLIHKADGFVKEKAGDEIEISFTNFGKRGRDWCRKENRTIDREHIGVVGADFGLREVMELVRHVAVLNSPVLLLGETGVGKDVIANAIHQLSLRRENPFIVVNCGGIPESLIDSELFGHEKGAFTGALSKKRGRFERADKGTIFLDEIGELPPKAQVRLLRVLQNQVIERVGATSSIGLDIRVIAATNRNLKKMVKQGEFREDLWFRLNVFPITIPPLRQRPLDIPALVQYFIEQKSSEMNLPDIPKLADGAVEGLMDYAWPGNVRELQNIVERSLILKPRGPVSFDHLDHKANRKRAAETPIEEGPYRLDDVIIAHINRVLAKTGGKVHGPDGAAGLLGINSSTLRNKMNKLGIQYGRKQK